jgi:transposase-like protein
MRNQTGVRHRLGHGGEALACFFGGLRVVLVKIGQQPDCKPKTHRRRSDDKAGEHEQRRWALKFGRAYAARIRQRGPRPSDRWHLDEVFIRIGGKIHYLWRAIDDEGEVLDIIVQPRRDRKAALKLMRRLLKRQGYLPDAIVTDRLRSYGAALRDLGLTDRHVTGGRSNNRAEVSHQPTRRRERQRRGFRSPGSAQRFLATHADVYDHFNV